MEINSIIFDRRFVFRNTSQAWDTLLPHWNRPWVDENNKSLPRLITLAANIAKKTVLAVAFAVATIAAGIFDLLMFPYHVYKYTHIKEPNRLPAHEMEAIKKEISDYINTLETNGTIEKIPPKTKEKMIVKIANSYARSKTIYGPIVRIWAEHLLELAQKNNRKLIFMARDGIAPFHMAKGLMKKDSYKAKFPQLVGDDKIVLGYFSRRLITNANGSKADTQLFQEYLQKELGIKAGDRCLFVDVGFEGSMINTIRELAKPVIFPNPQDGTKDNLKEALQFEFLISLKKDRAAGFLATEHTKLESVPFAGGNLGVHWLEDSHQGNLKSPTSLIKTNDGRIYPNTKLPGTEKIRVAKKGSPQYLLRKFSNRAIKHCIDMDPVPGISEKATPRNPKVLNNINASEFEKVLFKKRATILFDQTITLIKSFKLPLYMEHL